MPDNYSFRPCRASDLEAMREICIETSSLPLKNEKDRRFLLLMYCDAYVELFLDDCFVAADESDRAVGYILCAASTHEYLKSFHKSFLPEIAKLGFAYSMRARLELAGQAVCEAFAPAHLHIDLTEPVRHKGVGTELMNTLKRHLSGQGINRVQLTCGSENKVAISFYRKNGFKTVLRGFGACVMRSDTK